jgi:hypothetical protein
MAPAIFVMTVLLWSAFDSCLGQLDSPLFLPPPTPTQGALIGMIEGVTIETRGTIVAAEDFDAEEMGVKLREAMKVILTQFISHHHHLHHTLCLGPLIYTICTQPLMFFGGPAGMGLGRQGFARHSLVAFGGAAPPDGPVLQDHVRSGSSTRPQE